MGGFWTWPMRKSNVSIMDKVVANAFFLLLFLTSLSFLHSATLLRKVSPSDGPKD